MKTEPGMKRRLATGYIVASILFVILVTEYFIGDLVHSGGWPYILVLALAAASITAYYIMHINQVRSRSRKHGND